MGCMGTFSGQTDKIWFVSWNSAEFCFVGTQKYFDGQICPRTTSDMLK